MVRDGQVARTTMKFDISAKASLEVKAEIPTTSVGRFVDALTDIVRPWSEYRGLKADVIRLQREDVAFEIARRAQARIALENTKIMPIPLKTLIPLLEKGSQEAPTDDFMIDMWANLLASAATTDDSVPPRYVSILAELNSRQAKLLSKINEETGAVKLRGDRDVRAALKEFLESDPKENEHDISPVFECLKANYYGLFDILIMKSGKNGFVASRSTEHSWDDIQILNSLGLIQMSHFNEARRDYTAVLQCYKIAVFGILLMKKVTPKVELAS